MPSLRGDVRGAAADGRGRCTATCPDGHVDTTRLLSVFARTGGATPSARRRAAAAAAGPAAAVDLMAPGSFDRATALEQLGADARSTSSSSAAASPAPAWPSTPPAVGCAPRSSSGTTSPAARRRRARSSSTAGCATCRTATCGSCTRRCASASACAATRRTSCGCCPFLIPMFSKDGLINPKVARALGSAMWMYDLTGGARIGKLHKRLKKAQAVAHMPTLPEERLAGAYLYYDAAADDARLTLTILRTAALDHGAVVANHAAVVELLHDDGQARGRGRRGRRPAHRGAGPRRGQRHRRVERRRARARRGRATPTASGRPRASTSPCRGTKVRNDIAVVVPGAEGQAQRVRRAVAAHRRRRVRAHLHRHHRHRLRRADRRPAVHRRRRRLPAARRSTSSVREPLDRGRRASAPGPGCARW